MRGDGGSATSQAPWFIHSRIDREVFDSEHPEMVRGYLRNAVQAAFRLWRTKTAGMALAVRVVEPATFMN